jgi:hypothetical protein
MSPASHKIGGRHQQRKGVGMPASILLEHFGEIVRDAFGAVPYLVGSALQGKEWRDVDIRLILSDEEFEHQVGPLTKPLMCNPRWAALCLAFATLGREMTGLPIDFQIQQQSAANAEEDGPRSALILMSLARQEDTWRDVT